MLRKLAVMLTVAASLGACADSRGLNKKSIVGNGPDEFTTVPTRPLELPQSLSALPTPTPGGANLTDTNPQADAVAALGGSLRGGVGVPSSDAALVSRSGRFGVDPTIRSDLAVADAQFRKRRGRAGVLGIGRSNSYYRAYAGQALDAYAELSRFRAAGVSTPTAPPR